MMQHQDQFVFGWDAKSSKRSSGLFSVLKWFSNNKDTLAPPPDLISSTSSSSDSIESVYSTESVASFAFVPPTAYRPYGPASQAEKYILPGPETSTYRARLAQREVSRESDRNLTLRSKYKLYKAPEPERGHSLPLIPKEQKMHRRTASESSKHKRAGAYCHVKGKRKAPQPPGIKGESTLRRKKRLAPQPPNPDIIQNDSLKLERGILKATKEPDATVKIVTVPEVVHVPKPWYKRTLGKSIIPEKKPDTEKRKSGLSFLTNISELDREAMEILGKENLKMKYLKNSQYQAPAFMRPHGSEHSRTNSDSWITPKRKSAKDLIAKFNAITGVSRVSLHSGSSKESIKEQTPPACDKKEYIIPIIQEVTPSTSDVKTSEAERSQIGRTAVVKPSTRTQWNCPKCTLENDYWRIICKVCSTIKPYFDDFTTTATSTTTTDETKNDLNETTNTEVPKNDLFGLGSTEMRISELQRSVLQSQYPKLSSELKEDPLSVAETKNILSQYQKIPPEKIDTPKVADTRSIFQQQYPKVNLNYEFKNEPENVFQPQYPRITLGTNKEIELSPLKSESIKPVEKIRNSIFDFPKPENVEIKMEESKTPKLDRKNSEKMILGDELSFKEPKKDKYLPKVLGDEFKEVKKDDKFLPIITKVEYKKIPGEQIKIEDVTNVEKMILGDELSVEKPDYINVNKYEKIENPDLSKLKNSAPKLEKMILGDEISVKKSGVEFQKSPDPAKGAISKTKPPDEEKQNSAKREEREKLKKMLIEMKNSLPKRYNKNTEQKHRVSLIQEQTEIETTESPQEEKTAELIIATTETIYENIKVKNIDKPLKVSSSVQTNAVFRRAPTQDEASAIKSNPSFQLIGAKDFVGISNEKTGNCDGSHTYANLFDAGSNLPDLFAGCSKTDTLEINRLLRRLETAIAGGELGQAAVFARELAQLKVPLSVIRQKADKAGVEETTHFNVDMYVEDKVSHRGPFPLQVSELMTVAELKILVEEKYKIPRGVQRWILGKELAAEDGATLREHQVTTSGCPVFLYLVAPAPDAKPDATIEIVEVNDLEIQPPQFENEPTEPLVEEELDDLIQEIEIEENTQNLWKCRACTLLNPIAIELCEVCGLKRDENKIENNATYLQLVNLDNEDLIRNLEAFECLVCLSECLPGDGVTLRECLHQFCRVCLANTVEFSEEAEVKCPYRDEQYACDIALQDREVKALVSAQVYEQHLAKSVKLAENKMDKTFHCKTPDCKGWCIFEDNVNDFHCPVCRKTNCLTCQAIHAGMNCKQYQEQMKSQSETDEDARRTRDFLEDMIKRGEALACPTCQVVLLKKWGCDWLRCSMCKTEICWVTRGPRWGAGGKGDTSGGCKCGVNGIKCHPKCNYCH